MVASDVKSHICHPFRQHFYGTFVSVDQKNPGRDRSLLRFSCMSRAFLIFITVEKLVPPSLLLMVRLFLNDFLNLVFLGNSKHVRCFSSSTVSIINVHAFFSFPSTSWLATRSPPSCKCSSAPTKEGLRRTCSTKLAVFTVKTLPRATRRRSTAPLFSRLRWTRPKT